MEFESNTEFETNAEVETNAEIETITEFEEITEFEDMKIIWDSQNEEKLYAINESALYAQIKRKGKSVTRTLQRFEVIMVAANLAVGIGLIAVTFMKNAAAYEYATPAVYLAYAILALVWRHTRRQEDVSFEETMLGELDKAIWQINYLIKRSRELILWYLLPLALLIGGMMLYEGKPLFALAIIAVMGLAGLVTDRWEIKRCYLPKKHSLESLRAKLVAADA